MKEGKRIFLYENFVVMTSAGILGFGIGIVTIIMVTVQFYLFVELDWHLEFPLILFIVLVLVSIITTYFSVHIPMQSVNTKSISSQIKANGQ